MPESTYGGNSRTFEHQGHEGDFGGLHLPEGISVGLVVHGRVLQTAIRSKVSARLPVTSRHAVIWSGRIA